MLFNSYPFIFLYLPFVLLGFFWIAKNSHFLAALFLATASLVFYGCWNPLFVFLLLGSICFNYAMGYAIGHAPPSGGGSGKSRRILVVAIGANLLLLAYFKYVNFFVGSLSHLLGTPAIAIDIILPLGISFFTFTQIAFLVDVYRGIAREYSFVHYLLFVTYFPHLVAGPVLHHRQMMPQFGNAITYKFNIENVNIGTTIFVVGLFKKVVLADQFALYANPVFDAAEAGGEPRLVEAWVAALAYSLQLYFDFSGYSDMAIGLSRMFNVKLPLNFDSPYKAKNIIDFWQRWHMTLSAFLKDYLYIPLGGNRQGVARRYVNLMATMLLGGLWHGAAWNFVLWGGLHGVFLVINHAWRNAFPSSNGGKVVAAVSLMLTFFLVGVAWVPFRAPDIDSALRMWSGMAGLNGISFPPRFAPWFSSNTGAGFYFDGFAPLSGLLMRDASLWLLIGLFVVWGLPNTQQWLASVSPAWDKVALQARIVWMPNRLTAFFLGAAFAGSLIGMTRASPFLYFQF